MITLTKKKPLHRMITLTKKKPLHGMSALVNMLHFPRCHIQAQTHREPTLSAQLLQKYTLGKGQK